MTRKRVGRSGLASCLCAAVTLAMTMQAAIRSNFVPNWARSVVRDIRFSLLSVLMLSCASTAYAELTVDTPENRDRLQTYVGMYNELADRRRKIIYTEHPVTALNGVQHEFVHVSSGSSAFGRTDLVVDSAMPIVVRRTYDSARETSRTFGDSGWEITLDETVVRTDGGSFVYSYGNGTSIRFNRDGQFLHRIAAFLSDVVDLKVLGKNRLLVRTRTGLNKYFRQIDQEFRLSKVVDAFDNTHRYHYQDSTLVGVTSGDGAAINLHYDNHSRLTRVTDTIGREVRYTYDDGGRLTAARDFRGQEWTFAYSKDNSLEKSYTPNGITDLEFYYGPDGRVIEVVRNGVPTQFKYDGVTTTATDSLGRSTRFESDENGMTSRVHNASNTETRLELHSSGVPESILRNDKLVTKFSYRSTDAPAPNAVSIDAGATRYKINLDTLGRVVRVVAKNDPASSYRVQYVDSSSLAPSAITTEIGDTRRIKYDSSGHLYRYSADPGEQILIQRSGRSVRYHKKGGGGAVLLFNEFGQLHRVQSKQGNDAYFEYDRAGLRESSVVGTGEQVDYLYDATGNLLSTVLANQSGDKEYFVYGLSPHNRLEYISKEGVGIKASFEYDALGLPSKATSTEIIGLDFEHDTVGRLVTVTPDGAERLDYAYGPGEPSIAEQFDTTTSLVHMQRKELSAFSGREDVFLQRVRPSGYGFVMYDQSIQELVPWVNPERWSPDQHIRNMLENTRVNSLLEKDGPNYYEFSKPSNRFFIPPELQSINCCFCCSSNEYVHCEIP